MYYLAADEGSLPTRFPPESVAWVSTVSGEPRWWKKSYGLGENILLFEARTEQQALPGIQEKQIVLASFLHERPGADYAGFIVLPVPRRRAGMVPGRRRGAIHVSFASEQDFNRIWTLPGPPRTPAETGTPARELLKIYDNPELALTAALNDPCLRMILSESMGVLGAAIQHFNEAVFEAHIRPCRQR